MRRLFPLSLFVLLTGCLGHGARPELNRAQPLPTSPPLGVVFVADGAGDFRTLSTNLRKVVGETATPVRIETMVWSHGFRRYLRDQVDHDHHLAQGRLLAAQVLAYRQTYPRRRISLIGHSAGCAVLLAAAEQLPPQSVDRILLLAPSVSIAYDLRPALRTTRAGIEVFYSNEDRLILGLGMKIVGTAEGSGCRKAAGQYGFTPILACPEDATLYGKLRQYPWAPIVAWSGHNGSHGGSVRPTFLQAYVLPLLVRD